VLGLFLMEFPGKRKLELKVSFCLQMWGDTIYITMWMSWSNYSLFFSFYNQQNIIS
jgi:hypothetical protein